ncbi:extracellular matrix organizing protein FRAS1-like [Gigantopelta aegis]|uniref:extracellular matrix organizing protein FRAS1-like n=1 Tax=Gigantopelta aegis TaxID=1735272 RepID=UPI001B88910A|nr:extracellular matrix organizing protein FRAS1-like [Gigantopelta aegis]
MSLLEKAMKEKGTTLERSENACCPKCLHNKCVDADREYEHGDQWQRDPCTFCTCVRGAAECRTRSCVDAPRCRRNEKQITRLGECCPECVLKESVCVDEHPIRYHGDIWNVSSCEYCMCKNSKVQCRRATCEYVRCQKGEVLQQVAGRCCQQCVKPRHCQHGDFTHQDGDTWHPDPCSVCNCEEGKVVCYKRACPLCPRGTYHSVTQGQCCGQCLKVECSSACSECLPTNPSHCVRCKEFGKLAQDGLCVDQCKDTFYPTRDNTCGACAEFCQSCVDQSSFHCLLCRPGRLWKDGYCVEQCGHGFYLRNSQCLACHSTCSSCSGSGRSQCLSCSYAGHVLHQGRCIDSCGARFFLQSQECFACPPFCRTCQPNSEKCATCHSGTVFFNGNCLPACPKGFYSRQSSCTACHPSCASCSGGRHSSCLSCHHGYDLRRGTCLSLCAEGQYVSASGQCKACGRGCKYCFPNTEGEGFVCSQCVDSGFVPTVGQCGPRCQQGFYLQDNICKGCDEQCEQCEGPARCTRCLPPFVLADGHCVQTCGHQRYPDSERICRFCDRHCLQCSEKVCLMCDSRTFLKDGTCVGVCGTGFITDYKNRLCQANVSPPVLRVSGLVYVKEGSIVPIPADIFYLRDADTASDKLRLVVLGPPNSGHLVKALHGHDQVLGQEDHFTVQDLQEGKVRFVHSRRTWRNDKVILRATDGALYSEEAFFVIQVTAKEPPAVLKNEPLTAIGGEKTIIRREVLDFQSSGRSVNNKIYILQDLSQNDDSENQCHTELIANTRDQPAVNQCGLPGHSNGRSGQVRS